MTQNSNPPTVGQVSPNCVLAINYDLTVEELIVAGNYLNGPSITSWNFRNFHGDATGQKSVTVCLVSFGSSVTSHEALEKFKSLNFRPATLKEILFFGIDYPDVVQRVPEGKVIALGSGFKGIKRWYVPFIADFGAGRLEVHPTRSRRWSTDTRFAVVPL